ncbi:MAG: Spy/CpxP family protein refolding chaperone [bacterium]|nr:Spy/CpxP family protein refolding chaperone [bacterium]
MTDKRLIIVGSIVLTIALVGMVGYVTAGPGGKLFTHGGGHFGGGAGMHCVMSGLIEELDLSESQHQYLENAHKVVEERVHAAMGDHGAHAEAILAQLESGDVNSAEVRQAIDEHIEAAREIAYSVSDELVAFVNSLDEEQRAKLTEHLKKAHEHAKEHHGSGHGIHSGH